MIGRSCDSSEADHACIRVARIKCEEFSLEYKLIKRKNVDYMLYVDYLYDIMVSKMPHDGSPSDNAIISSVSSKFERALDMFECISRNTVTPICVADFFEEYHSVY